MAFLNHFLRDVGASAKLNSLFQHITRSTKSIHRSLSAANTGKTSSVNQTGDQQVEMDLISDAIILDEMTQSKVVNKVVSEEQENILEIESTEGNFIVAYDPLDGSSLVEANMTIGTIFGIWEKEDFLGSTTRDGMVASCYALYGPRLRLGIAIVGKGTHEFEMDEMGEFSLTRKNIQIKDGSSSYFSPGNLRCCETNESYFQLITNWIKSSRTLRYSGCMIPDIHHSLAKGEGIFTYPADTARPNGKLRVLYECAPFSLVMEEAGGASLNQNGEPILDVMVTEIHQKTPIFCGSKRDVESSVEFLSI